MTTIQTDTVTVAKAPADVFAFLHDMNNFQKLMPQDKVSDWESTDETCRFNLNGMASIGMKRESSAPPNQINIVADGKNPFDFNLEVRIDANGEQSNCQLIFNGKLNPMLRMMAVTPLTNFFNLLAKNLQQQLA